MYEHLVAHLCARHLLQTIFLYGSRAQGTHRPDSDFDLLLVRDGVTSASSSREERDVHDFEGLLVDAWVHTPESLDPENDAGLLRLQSSVLLFDRDGFGAGLLARVNEVAAKGPRPMSDGDRGAYRVWLPKMIARLQGPDSLVAGHYRAELLNALLPTWFQARREWYRGTRHASAWLRQHVPDVALAFEAALAPGAPVAAIERAVALILREIDHPDRNLGQPSGLTPYGDGPTLRKPVPPRSSSKRTAGATPFAVSGLPLAEVPVRLALRPPMTSSPVLTEARGDVALLTLARPPANALDLDLLLALGRAVTDAQAARAIVLTGSDRFFSAGLDLAYVLSLQGAQGLAFAEAFDNTMTTLFAAPGPVVAALSGHAVAGGAVIAAAADFRLMAAGPSRIGLPEIKVGVPFPVSALEIVRHAWQGPHLARLLFQGDTVDAATALSLGLIDELVAPEALLEKALALATGLAAAPRATFSATKRVLRAPGLSRIHAARAAGPDPVWEVWRSPEVRATIAAYSASVLRRK